MELSGLDGGLEHPLYEFVSASHKRLDGLDESTFLLEKAIVQSYCCFQGLLKIHKWFSEAKKAAQQSSSTSPLSNLVHLIAVGKQDESIVGICEAIDKSLVNLVREMKPVSSKSGNQTPPAGDLSLSFQNQFLPDPKFKYWSQTMQC